MRGCSVSKVDVPTYLMAPGRACEHSERTNTTRVSGAGARRSSVTHTFCAMLQPTTVTVFGPDDACNTPKASSASLTLRRAFSRVSEPIRSRIVNSGDFSLHPARDSSSQLVI